MKHLWVCHIHIYLAFQNPTFPLTSLILADECVLNTEVNRCELIQISNLLPLGITSTSIHFVFSLLSQEKKYLLPSKVAPFSLLWISSWIVFFSILILSKNLSFHFFLGPFFLHPFKGISYLGSLSRRLLIVLPQVCGPIFLFLPHF